MSDAPPLLQAIDIHKRFGSTRALKGASIELHRGEVLGLIGDNGAGKSTLVKIVAGVYRADSGRILVEGVEQTFQDPADSQGAGIETVFQTLSLIPSLDITENIFLNRELYGPGRLLTFFRRIHRSRMQRIVDESYSRLGLELPASETKVVALSGGQQQAVAIARAVIWERKIAVLDEPTAALGVRQTQSVLRFIRRLRDEGLGVLLITHNMEHMMEVADRVTVLRLGESVYTARATDTTARLLVEQMTGAVPVALRLDGNMQ